jgi:hypothetical protein
MAGWAPLVVGVRRVAGGTQAARIHLGAHVLEQLNVGLLWACIAFTRKLRSANDMKLPPWDTCSGPYSYPCGLHCSKKKPIVRPAALRCETVLLTLGGQEAEAVYMLLSYPH